MPGKHAYGTGGNVHGSKTGGGGAKLSGNRGAEYRSKGRIHDKGKPQKRSQPKNMSTRHDA